VNDPPLIPVSTARRLSLAGLLLLLLCAAALRSRHLDDPFWVDELHTGWTVQGEWSEIGPRANAGNQPAAYFSMLWPLARLFGSHELVLRMPSLLASLALVLLVPWLVMKAGGSWWGAAGAALLTTLDATTTVFAAEARPYALVQLVVLLHLATLLARLAALTGTRKEWLGWRIGWTLSAVLLVHLHFTTILVLAAELPALWWICRQQKINWRRWALDASVLLLCCLPLLDTLLLVHSRRHNWAEFIPQPSMWGLLTRLPLLACLAIPLLCLVPLNRDRSRRPDAGRPPLSLSLRVVAAICLLPLLVAWLLSRLDVARLWHPRYVVSASVLLPLLTGLLLSYLPGSRQKQLLATVATLLLVLLVAGAARDCWRIGPRQEYWPAALALIDESDPAASLPVMLCPGLIEDEGLLDPSLPAPLAGMQIAEFCLFPLAGPYQLAKQPPLLLPLATSSQALTAVAAASVKQHGGGWLIVRGTMQRARDWATELVGTGLRVRAHGFGRVHVLKLDYSAPGPTPGK
jgi:hypothetical protein